MALMQSHAQAKGPPPQVLGSGSDLEGEPSNSSDDKDSKEHPSSNADPGQSWPDPHDNEEEQDAQNLGGPIPAEPMQASMEPQQNALAQDYACWAGQAQPAQLAVPYMYAIPVPLMNPVPIAPQPPLAPLVPIARPWAPAPGLPAAQPPAPIMENTRC
jgi:hypothetical protein